MCSAESDTARAYREAFDAYLAAKDAFLAAEGTPEQAAAQRAWYEADNRLRAARQALAAEA